LNTTPDKLKKEEGRRKKEEGRGKREEGRGKKEEGRGKREEGRGEFLSIPFSPSRPLCLSSSF
jgi:hypothetical protein